MTGLCLGVVEREDPIVCRLQRSSCGFVEALPRLRERLGADQGLGEIDAVEPFRQLTDRCIAAFANRRDELANGLGRCVDGQVGPRETRGEVAVSTTEIQSSKHDGRSYRRAAHRKQSKSRRREPDEGGGNHGP